jgi:type IX secretion system PorP/SprF family membrane protein
MKKSILFIAISFASVTSIAQQTPQSNVYSYNKYSINPAYAGASGCTEINFSHLNQWVKIDGAPLTSLLSVNTRIGKSLGIGGQLLIDKIGMIQQFSGLGTVSYGLDIAKVHRLRAGVSIGYNQYRINPATAIAFDNQDPIINGGLQSAGAVNTEIGLSYNWNNLELAIASKQLLQTYSNFGYNNLDGYGLRRHMSALLGYRIGINDNWSVKPSIWAKGTNNGYQMDINTDVNYKNFIFGGLGYRSKVGLIGRIGVNIQNLFFIGYAYESPMSNIASYSSGSHEVIIGLKFCKKEKKPTEEVKNVVKDTTTIAKKPEVRIDTVFIEKVDTIYIENNAKQSSIEAKKTVDLINKSIQFEFDKAIVQKNSFGELESLINILQSRPDIKIELEGHTDAEGPESYNVNLSKSRVNAVKDFLIANGIDSNRILTNFLGEKKPKANNSTTTGRKQNRRVDIRFVE